MRDGLSSETGQQKPMSVVVLRAVVVFGDLQELPAPLDLQGSRSVELSVKASPNKVHTFLRGPPFPQNTGADWRGCKVHFIGLGAL